MKKDSLQGETGDRSLTSPDEIVELSVLYDRYGVLLKDNQREVFEAYVLDNLSLGEISDEYGITRQGVYDTINRARKKLREYEDRLQLIGREEKIRDLIKAARIDEDEKERLLTSIEDL